MNGYRAILTFVLILFVFICMPAKLFACGGPPYNYPPVAVFTVSPNLAIVNEDETVDEDEEILFDGFLSGDIGGTLVKMEWDFDYDGTTFTMDAEQDPPTTKQITDNPYSEAGTYVAALRVTDNGGKTSMATCTIKVVRIFNTRSEKLYTTITEAINDWDTYNGDTIELGKDIYKENLDFTAAGVNGKVVTLRSTDPDNWDIVSSTIIAASDPAAPVIRLATLDYDTVSYSIEGLKITGGSCGINYDTGDANNISTVNTQIRNCIITDNYNTDNGGGVFCNYTENLTIENCFIVGNTTVGSGGGIYIFEASAVIRNCIISKNEASSDKGGGIYNYLCSPAITNCTITDNTATNGGGVYNDGASCHPIITNTIFWNSSASSEIFNENSSFPRFGYCCIRDCFAGGSWVSSLGINDGGNTEDDPNFVIAQDSAHGNLVAHWELDDDTGGIAGDSTANNHYGTIYNATLTASGKLDNGFVFDGDNDYIQISNHSDFDFPAGFTLCAWVKPDLDCLDGRIIYRYDPFSKSGYFISQSQTYGGCYGVVAIVNGNGVHAESEETHSVAGQWAHVVGVREDNGDLKLYVNGALQTEINNISGAVDSSGDVFIGVDYVMGKDFAGTIDDARIYNRALTGNEVRQLYRTSNYKYCLGSTSTSCLNAGDSNGDYSGQKDIDFEVREQFIADIGADEYSSLPEIPDLTGMTESEAIALIGEIDGITYGLSVYYYSDAEPGTVIDQSEKGIVPYGTVVDLVVKTDDILKHLLVAHWELDGTAEDSTDNELDGTLHSSAPDWEPQGKIGGAYNFSNSYIEVQDHSELDISEKLTLCAWIKPNAFNTTMTIISKGRDCAYALWHDGNNKLQFQAVINGTPIEYAGDKELDHDEWYHVAAVYDGTKVQLYVDGEPNSSPAYSGPIGQGDLSLLIGKDYWTGGCNSNLASTNYPFNGLIDDVRIYKEALTEGEVRKLYNPDLPVVPYLRNKTEAEAETILNSSLLNKGTVTEQCDNTVAIGCVISSDPAPGTVIWQGNVNLVISKGTNVVVLAGAGVTEHNARNSLNNNFPGSQFADVSYGESIYVCSDAADYGKVIDVLPADIVPCGTVVDLVVGSSQATDVPYVTGMNENDAIAVIGATANITYGSSTTACSDTVPAGYVISHPSTVSCNGIVDLVVSNGEANEVPDLKGMTKADAGAILWDLNGVKPGDTSGCSCSDDMAVGLVVWQSAIGDVPCDTYIDFKCSSGPAVVPNVSNCGMTEADAITVLNEVNDVSYGSSTTACHDTIPAGEVISQNPPAGFVPCGTVVDLVVSSGQPSVPGVTGMTEADAIAAINAVADISYGSSTYKCDNSVSSGDVISQSATGTVSCGTVVDLVVSSGQADLPDVTGMDETSACNIINAIDGLSCGTITGECSDSVSSGNVISQYPAAGSVDCDTAVDLVISTGQPDVPDFSGGIGLPEALAITALNEMDDVRYGSSTTACSDTVPAGRVISQSYTGTVPCGTVVDLVVSTGQPDVPDFSGGGTSEAAAITALNEMEDVSYGSSTTACSDTIPAGEVISQNPPAGFVPCGTVVDLVVSTGQPDVPGVGGIAEADAIAVIDAVENISYGSTTYVCSTLVAKGTVISQSNIGVSPCGTVVDLTVSRPEIFMPDVTGMTETDAKNTISAVDGITVTFGPITYQCHGTIAANLVISQSVIGLVECGADIEVDLILSKGPPVYVDASRDIGGDGLTWGTAYKYLQDAIAAVSSGDEIWVANGTYYPDVSNNNAPDGNDNPIHTFTLPGGVILYGGFSGSSDTIDPGRDEVSIAERHISTYQSVLSGDIDQDDKGLPASGNSYHVVTGTDDAVINGFVIRGGYADGTGNDSKGGGMYNAGTSPMVVNCHFFANYAQSSGGGMYNVNGSSPTLINCLFSGNAVDSTTAAGDHRGGSIYNNASAPVLINCTISNNIAYDTGGIYNDGSSSSSLTNCILWDNRDGYNATPSQNQQITDAPGAASAASYSCIQDDTQNDDNIPYGGTNKDLYPEFVNPGHWEDWGDIPENSLVVEATIRDFKGYYLQDYSTTNPDGHPDFQNMPDDDFGREVGIVGPLGSPLGSDGKPIYSALIAADGNNPVSDCNHINCKQKCSDCDCDCDSTHGVDWFYWWFNDDPEGQINKSLKTSLILRPTGVDNEYKFEDITFYPIDGQLFNVVGDEEVEPSYHDEGKPTQGESGYPYTYHNYHFTTELKTDFYYDDSIEQNLKIQKADDDLFIYINNILVVDLGGVHEPKAKYIKINENGDAEVYADPCFSNYEDTVPLGLVGNVKYSFHIFFAERHTTWSHFEFTTTLKLIPKLTAGDYHLGVGSPYIDAGNNAVFGTYEPYDFVPYEDPDGKYDFDIRSAIDGSPRKMDDPDTDDTGSGGAPIIDLGAYEYPRIWYVNRSVTGGNGRTWATAFNDLQDALAAALPSDQIWVAVGTYTPDSGTNDPVRTFTLREDVTVYGGFAGNEIDRDRRNWRLNETILSGDIGAPGNYSDNSYHVVTGVDNAILDGFTITDGFAGGSGAYANGAGMYNTDCSLTIRNCTFSGNRAVNDGGGMYNYAGGSTITNCIFNGNYALGGEGAGMYNYVFDGSLKLTITKCIFNENNAGGNGGGMCTNNTADSAGSPTITNCVFSNNYASGLGAGMRNLLDGGITGPTITNCTFVGNTTDSPGGGIHNTGGYVIVANCILYGNLPDQISDSAASSLVTYSNIQGGWPAGDGNIDSPPLFLSLDKPAGPDEIFMTADDGLNINKYSPCVDTGVDPAVNPLVPEKDITGFTRVDIADIGNTNAATDMGAYEYRPDTYFDPIYVDAGADKKIVLPVVTVLLDDAVAGGGNPELTTKKWIPVSVPPGCDISFNPSFVFDGNDPTTAELTVNEELFQTHEFLCFVLMLEINDGYRILSDKVVIRVYPGIDTNLKPEVEAGGPYTVEVGEWLTLDPTVTDDGKPHGGYLGFEWTLVGFPMDPVGGVIFDSELNQTTKNAKVKFTVPDPNGSDGPAYALKLTVKDSPDSEQTSSDIALINVISTNVAPEVEAGDDCTATLGLTFPLTIDLAADAVFGVSGRTTPSVIDSDGGPETLQIRWRVASGDMTAVEFQHPAPETMPPASGEVKVTFARPGVYTLELSAYDGRDRVTDTVVITLQPVPFVQAGENKMVQLYATGASPAYSATVDLIDAEVIDRFMPDNISSTDWTVITEESHSDEWDNIDSPFYCPDCEIFFSDSNQVNPSVTVRGDDPNAIVGVYKLKLTATDPNVSDPGEDEVYVSVYRNSENPVTYKKNLYISDIDLAQVATYEIDGNNLDFETSTSVAPHLYPTSLAIDRDSKTIFVSFDEIGKLFLIDASTVSDMGTIDVPGAGSLGGLVYDHSRHNLYVVDRDGDFYSYSWYPAGGRLVLDTGASISLEGIDNVAYGLALDESRGRLYVCGGYTSSTAAHPRPEDKIIRYYNSNPKINPNYALWEKMGQIPKTGTLPHAPVGMCVDTKLGEDGRIYTGTLDDNTPDLLCSFDIETGTINSCDISDANVFQGFANDKAMGLTVDEDTHYVYFTVGHPDNSVPFQQRVVVVDKDLDYLSQASPIGDPPDANIGAPADIIYSKTAYKPSAGVLTKTKVSSEDIVPGIEIKFMIFYEIITGGELLQETYLTDELSLPFTFVSASGNGIYDSDTHTVEWYLGDLANGNTGSFEVVVKLNDWAVPYTTITNKCVIDGYDKREEAECEITTHTWTPDIDRIYVNEYAAGGSGSTWETALRSLQDALALAGQIVCYLHPEGPEMTEERIEIWVAGDCQIPGFDSNDTFNLRSYVNVYGGFGGTETSMDQRNPENETILFGAGNDYVVTANCQDPILDGFTISYGGIAGILCSTASPTISKCKIVNNLGIAGISCINSSAPRILNSMICNNNGDGIKNESDAAISITNCTIASNTGYGYNCDDCAGSAAISNTIFWGHYGEYTGSPDLRNCYIEGHSETYPDKDPQGNFGGTDPFKDIAMGDYHLASDSVCRDEGENTFVEGERDVDGELRIVNTLVDIGADEIQSIQVYAGEDKEAALPTGSGTVDVHFTDTSITIVDTSLTIADLSVEWTVLTGSNPVNFEEMKRVLNPIFTFDTPGWRVFEVVVYNDNVEMSRDTVWVWIGMDFDVVYDPIVITDSGDHKTTVRVINFNSNLDIPSPDQVAWGEVPGVIECVPDRLSALTERPFEFETEVTFKRGPALWYELITIAWDQVGNRLGRKSTKIPVNYEGVGVEVSAEPEDVYWPARTVSLSGSVNGIVPASVRWEVPEAAEHLVSFSNSSSYETQMQFLEEPTGNKFGTDVVFLAMDDYGYQIGAAIVHVELYSSLHEQSQMVEAGKNQEITLPINIAYLVGEVTGDYGSVEWELIEAPDGATVTFTDDNPANGTDNDHKKLAVKAVFSVSHPGPYKFKFSAWDEYLEEIGSDSLWVTVLPADGGNITVDAGADSEVFMPTGGAPCSYTLIGTVEGLYNTVLWSEDSGSGPVTFDPPAANSLDDQDVIFSNPGIYEFSLMAMDAASDVLGADTVTVKVYSAVDSVTISAEPESLNLTEGHVKLTGTVELPCCDEIEWSVGEEVADAVHFSIDPEDPYNKLNKLVTFSRYGTFTIRLYARCNGVVVGWATKQITVTEPDAVVDGLVEGRDEYVKLLGSIGDNPSLDLSGTIIPSLSGLTYLWEIIPDKTTAAGATLANPADRDGAELVLTPGTTGCGVVQLSLTASYGDTQIGFDGSVKVIILDGEPIVSAGQGYPLVIAGKPFNLNKTTAWHMYGATNKTYTWECYPPLGYTIDSVLHPEVTFSDEGSYILTVTADDNYGVQSEASCVTITVVDTAEVYAGGFKRTAPYTPVKLDDAFVSVIMDDMTYKWTVTGGTGSGDVVFTTIHPTLPGDEVLNPTVTFFTSATEEETYELTLTVNDGEDPYPNSDTVEIAVQPVYAADTTPPEIISFTAKQGEAWIPEPVNGDILITVIATDDNVDRIELNVTGPGHIAHSGNYEVVGGTAEHPKGLKLTHILDTYIDGPGVIQATAYDIAGNPSATAEISFNGSYKVQSFSVSPEEVNNFDAEIIFSGLLSDYSNYDIKIYGTGDSTPIYTSPTLSGPDVSLSGAAGNDFNISSDGTYTAKLTAAGVDTAS
ncbi:MAG: PASTA domain-containing protein, partial [Sedimentisphaerales bacterium]|nr:PASTA domain-containing protein [Sedimentisphaerales bacterium]